MPHEIGEKICGRVEELAAISEDPAKLTRIFLTPEQRRASELVMSWMQAAAMATRLDAIGNVIGRYEGAWPGLPALVLGSHLDTVRDAGKYDGMLGVVTAIACVEALASEGMRLPFAIEVIGFADEEGVRFGTTMLGSRAVAGTFDPDCLGRRDADGFSMAEALRTFGLDPGGIAAAARRRTDILAYVELHIEQGPVLETLGLPVGFVTSISGANRVEVTITGEAGHAGTVPMAERKDALTAAAQCVLAVESRCRAEPDCVGTVGSLQVSPGAINVIPGQVRFSIDLRAAEDARRRRVTAQLLAEIAAVAADRKLRAESRVIHELAAAPCVPWLVAQVERAILAEGIAPFGLSSGAGHDGMAMMEIADIGMIFVRCARGISHHPDESVTVEDAEIGARVLLCFIKDFEPKGAL